MADIYHLVIQESVSSSDAFLDLYSYFHDIEYVVSANSLGQPADNPGAVTFGAVNWCTPDTIEPYSSRGPTTDGRIKPDVVGPDGVTNATYPPLLACSGFSGTSAAAPHGTGAAALVKQRLPCYVPAELKAYLEASVVDLGDPGKDNTYGSGRLLLGAPPADSDGDGIGDACDACPADGDGDGWTDVAEAMIGTDPADACADDLSDDAWPPDSNNDTLVTSADLSATAAAIGQSVPPAPARYDIDPDPPDQQQTSGDMSQVAARIGLSCAP